LLYGDFSYNNNRVFDIRKKSSIKYAVSNSMKSEAAAIPILRTKLHRPPISGDHLNRRHLLEKSVSAGVAYQPDPIGGAAGNLLGFGANWGEPNEAVFGSGLDDQYAFELFYRLQMTKELAITPDIQFLINPALNPDEDNIWVFGLRSRLAL
jgi:hypothetical protein